MATITTNEDFMKTLDSLSLQQQRIVASHFIRNVLDLAQSSHLKQVQLIAGKEDVTAEELLDGYHAAHAVYVRTNPRSDLNILDWNKQAEHFVAEACLTCLAPSYQEASRHHLAQKVAMYCRMARTCANIDHEGRYPSFENTEDAVSKEVDDQYRILSEFVAKR